MSDETKIKQLCKHLRLGANVVNLCRNIPYESNIQFTTELLERIAQNREEQRIETYRKQAGFDVIKNLEGFDFSNVHLPNGFDRSWLEDCSFIKDRINLLHIGNPGTGKTHLSIALGMRAAELGYRPLYRRTTKFIAELNHHFESGTLSTFIARLRRFDYIILDEWGYVPIHVTGTRLLFNFISEECYEKRSVVLTTNLPIAEWNRVFGDERLVVSLIDRLVHHGLIVKHEGQSYRLTHSLMHEVETRLRRQKK